MQVFAEGERRERIARRQIFFETQRDSNLLPGGRVHRTLSRVTPESALISASSSMAVNLPALADEWEAERALLLLRLRRQMLCGR